MCELAGEANWLPGQVNLYAEVEYQGAGCNCGRMEIFLAALHGAMNARKRVGHDQSEFERLFQAAKLT